MKASRIEKLGDVCDFIGGSQPPKSTFVYDLSELDETEYVRLIQIRDYKSDKHVVYIPKSSTKKFCSKDDIMIGRYGPPVFQILKGLEGAYNVALMKAVPKTKEIDSDYLFRFLASPEVQGYIIKLSERAAGQTGVNKQALHDYPILVPPISEQKRIVAILDQAFADIEQARAKTEQNLKNARELFESYLQQVFSQRGEGWQTSKLNKVCKLINGRAYKKPEMLTEGKYPLLRVGNFFSNRSWYYSDLELNDDKYCNKGDLLYAWSASFGPRIWDGGKTIYHYHIWKVEVQKTLVCRDFLYYWFHWDAERIKSEQGTGSTMIHVSMTSMNAREVSYPSINKQMELVRDLNKINLLVSDLEKVYSKKLNNIEELKKSILHKAFSGELTRTLEGETNKEAVA